MKGKFDKDFKSQLRLKIWFWTYLNNSLKVCCPIRRAFRVNWPQETLLQTAESKIEILTNGP